MEMSKDSNVEVVAFASSGRGLEAESINRGVEAMRAMGMRTLFQPDVFKSDTLGLSGSSSERADRFFAAATEPNTDLVMAFWGGYNTASLLEHIRDRLDTLENTNPIVGYSDTTSLLVMLYKNHYPNIHYGPSFISFAKPHFDPIYTGRHLLESLSGDTFEYTHPEGVEPPIIHRKGHSTGAALPVNLDTFTKLIGTRYTPDLDNAVLFVEEAEYIQPKSFYRNMTHLRDSGVFNKIGGLGIGRFTDESGVNTEHIEYIINETVPVGLPVVSGLAFGHADPIFTIPYGRTVEFDLSTSVPSIKFKRETK